jgi:formylmethanofuran dehydrogenase subunit B
MSAWIRGQAVDVPAAVDAAAASLSGARAPVIAGLAADVDALRAALALGARLGASFDPVSAAHLYADLAVLAGAGTVTTTPSETIARADLVVAVGARAAASSILDIVRSTEPTIGRARTRTVMLLREGGGPNSNERSFAVAPGEVAPALALVRALATGRQRLDHPLAPLAEALPKALYGVLLYDPGEIGELAVEMLQGLAAELNETTRVFTLPLADSWQGRALLQVSAWTTGTAPRLGLGRGFPEHDPWRFDAGRQAREKEIDAVMWLASVDAPRPDWVATVPSVALVRAPDGREGDVVFAVAAPGEDGDGVLWDERRGALVFRGARAAGAIPGAAAIVRAIDGAVAARRAA